jgi:hypothetical protein
VSAAVDGLRSCWAEGARLMWAVWIVSATCIGMSDDAMLGWGSRPCRRLGLLYGEVVLSVAPEQLGSTLLWEGPLSALLEPIHGEQAVERDVRRALGT